MRAKWRIARSGGAPFAARGRAPAVHASATPCSAARALGISMDLLWQRAIRRTRESLAVHASATPCSAARALAGYAPWRDGLASAHTPRAIKRLSSRALAALPAAWALAGYAPWHDGLASAHTPRAIKRLSSRALAALPAAQALASERFALMGTPPAPPLRATNHPSLRSPPMPPPRRLGTQMRRTYPSAAPFICLCSFSRTRGRCARGPRPPARSS